VWEFKEDGEPLSRVVPDNPALFLVARDPAEQWGSRRLPGMVQRLIIYLSRSIASGIGDAEKSI
jgi:hypothetical protein